MKFNESKEDVKELTIDSKIKSILDELSGHENSRVKSISKSIISHFQFGSVTGGKEMKIGRLIKNYHPTTEFPEGSIEMFVVAFAALNDGTSVIKVK
jgi:hypothetical protein